MDITLVILFKTLFIAGLAGAITFGILAMITLLTSPVADEDNAGHSRFVGMWALCLGVGAVGLFGLWLLASRGH